VHVLPLDEGLAAGGGRAKDIVALDDALNALAVDHERVSRVVELRYWLATVVLFYALPPYLSADNPAISCIGALLMGTLVVAVMMRVGAIAARALFIVSNAFLMFPMTFQLSVWYSRVGFMALAWAAIIAGFGFFVSIQGQKLLDIEGVEKAS
jgi:hypothetical protein